MPTQPALGTFETTLTLIHLPPTLAEVDAHVTAFLTPQGRHPLQWAIVKTDVPTNTLWIEGCCTTQG